MRHLARHVVPPELRTTGHWPITASNSSAVRGQCTRHRLSRQTVGSSVPGSRSRSAVMGLMGVSPPASCSSARASASEPSRRSAADKPWSRYGVQDGAMAIEEAGHTPRNPSHVGQFERFDHDLQRPDGQRPSAHPSVGRDLNGPRGVDHRQALWRQVKVHAFGTTLVLLRGRYTFRVSYRPARVGGSADMRGRGRPAFAGSVKTGLGLGWSTARA